MILNCSDLRYVLFSDDILHNILLAVMFCFLVGTYFIVLVYRFNYIYKFRRFIIVMINIIFLT